MRFLVLCLVCLMLATSPVAGGRTSFSSSSGSRSSFSSSSGSRSSFGSSSPLGSRSSFTSSTPNRSTFGSSSTRSVFGGSTYSKPATVVAPPASHSTTVINNHSTTVVGGGRFYSDYGYRYHPAFPVVQPVQPVIAVPMEPLVWYSDPMTDLIVFLALASVLMVVMYLGGVRF